MKGRTYHIYGIFRLFVTNLQVIHAPYTNGTHAIQKGDSERKRVKVILRRKKHGMMQDRNLGLGRFQDFYLNIGQESLIPKPLLNDNKHGNAGVLF